MCPDGTGRTARLLQVPIIWLIISDGLQREAILPGGRPRFSPSRHGIFPSGVPVFALVFSDAHRLHKWVLVSFSPEPPEEPAFFHRRDVVRLDDTGKYIVVFPGVDEHVRCKIREKQSVGLGFHALCQRLAGIRISEGKEIGDGEPIEYREVPD